MIVGHGQTYTALKYFFHYSLIVKKLCFQVADRKVLLQMLYGIGTALKQAQIETERLISAQVKVTNISFKL
jgi:hypothetical protein